jgi:hypothetical protein
VLLCPGTLPEALRTTVPLSRRALSAGGVALAATTISDAWADGVGAAASWAAVAVAAILKVPWSTTISWLGVTAAAGVAAITIATDPGEVETPAV